ncbi:MAG: peptidoglycan DD-metalloendopeptidase family protein [Pseudomonadales bacterium]
MMKTQATKAPVKDRQLRPALTEFMRRHAIVAGLATGVFALGMSFYPAKDVKAHRISTPLKLDLESLATLPPEETLEIEASWMEISVKSGDTLSTLFGKAGLNDGVMYQVLSNNKEAKQLTRLYPGQTLAFNIRDGQLEGLKVKKSPLETLLISKGHTGYRSDIELRAPEVRLDYRSATLNKSLFLDGQRAGLSQKVIMDMANVFGGVIDFVYDPRKGDTFEVLFEEHFLDGERFDAGDILAASYTNRGTTYTAYRYTDENGKSGYYSEDGVSMRKAFLRAPLDFTRVSSNFNPNRIHPVFKTKRPHRGVDYAASRGTPVYAAGDGKVIKAGYSKANGNYVFIQHGEAYVTKYLHLHKRFSKKGQRVPQGKVIGTVGSTGYATGPHLHYEFLVNGVHRNPRTILNKLPKAKSIDKQEMARFQQQLKPTQNQLAAYQVTRPVQLLSQQGKTTANGS